MSIIKFYNREEELKLLRKPKPLVAVIYGRRRVGKTTLILKFCENEDFLYFFVNPKKTQTLLIEEYFELVKHKLGLEEYMRPRNWEEFFSILFEKYKGIVVFDEFQWFLDVNPEVPFIIQKWLDMKKGLNIIISGSVVGMMRKLFLEEGSPLFKRENVIIKLEPFDYKIVFKILDSIGIKNVEEKIKFYMVFGGMPHYYNLLLSYGIKDFWEVIKTLVLQPHAPLKNEVEEIFKESLGKDYKTHFSILLAIGQGKTKLEEVSSYSSIKQTSIMAYIYDLRDLLEIIEERRYFGKRKKYYALKDNFSKFWFRYVYKNFSLLEVDWEKVFDEIKDDINNYFGLVFEDFAREFLVELSKKGEVSFTKIEKFVSYYRKGSERKMFEIDIACTDEKRNEITFFEVKWKELKKEEAENILKEMEERTLAIRENKKFGIIAKMVENKEGFRRKGYKIFDLRDIV